MTFHDKFSEIAGMYPDSPAVACKGNLVSYGELDKRSGEIAAELSEKGIGKGNIVPLEREPDEEWFAECLGIMKAGAAYAPISPTLPPMRREFILNDIKAKPAPEGAFAVYYTSGSTGKPKGVVLSHDGILAYCEMNRELFGLSHGIRSGVHSDIGFDSFLVTTMPMLCVGGVLYLMSAEERASLLATHRFFMKNKIETTFLTTQIALEYMRSFENKHMKVLTTGGEALRSYTPKSYEVWNLYGPAEFTVFVTAHKMKPSDLTDIPIGAPQGKTRAYITDGELCISGPQISLGYLNSPEETARNFVPNPYYNPETDEPCYSTMYKTGDLAEYTADGEILYRGRIDNQVKISGYRIEPREIETVILKHEDVLTVCVAVKYNKNGEPYLAAYYVPNQKGTPPEALKAFMEKSLPLGMIPRKFIALDSLPLSAITGKVDIAALPEPD